MGKSPVGRGGARAGGALPEGFWSLGWLFVASPAAASAAARDERNLAPSLWIYAAFLLASALFFSVKPYDFPDTNMPPPMELQDFHYWFKVNLWHPLLDGSWIVLLMGLLRWFKEGKLFPRMLGATAWAAIPGLLIMLYVEYKAFPWLVLALGGAAWLFPLRPLLKDVPREEWLPLAVFMLALNAVGLFLLLPMAVGLALRWKEGYLAVQIGGGLWILRNGALGLRELAGLRLSRAFLSILFSLFYLVGLTFLLHSLGAPKEILKAVFYG